MLFSIPGFFWVFLLTKSGLNSKSPVATLVVYGFDCERYCFVFLLVLNVVLQIKTL